MAQHKKKKKKKKILEIVIKLANLSGGTTQWFVACVGVLNVWCGSYIIICNDHIFAHVSMVTKTMAYTYTHVHMRIHTVTRMYAHKCMHTYMHTDTDTLLLLLYVLVIS